MRLPALFSVLYRRCSSSPNPFPTSSKLYHLRSLYLLALAQAWERFAFLSLLPLFVLCLEQHHGMTAHAAVLTFGVFQAASYLGALPAGVVADRALSHATTTLLGCALLTLGYGALALNLPTLLWPALGLMVCGHGFFKPGINALVSSRSGNDHSQREHAFLMLHVAINIGAMIGPLCAEWARARAGWVGVFYVATGGMLLSTLLLAVAAWHDPIHSPAESTVVDDKAQRGTDRDRVRAVRLLCAIAVVFWLTAQQAGTSLPLFAAQNTVQHIQIGATLLPLQPGHFAALHSLQVLLLVPLFFWATARLRQRAAEPSTPSKMLCGYVVNAIAFLVMSAASLTIADNTRVSVGWLSGCYLLLSGAEVLLAPLGLSLVTRLSPTSRLSQTVGLWLGSVALGSGLAGLFALLWSRWPSMRGHAAYFGILAALSLAAGALLLSQVRQLERLLQTPHNKRIE
jgi:POT family proton-dependent oligopeptide transporter